MWPTFLATLSIKYADVFFPSSTQLRGHINSRIVDEIELHKYTFSSYT